jgi:predicted alpha-1,2-mannosidase
MTRLRVHGRLEAVSVLATIAAAAALAGCGGSTPASPQSAVSAVGGSSPTPPSAPAGPLAVAAFVDQFVSTEDDFGQDLPGAYVPSGLAKVNPMTWPYRSHSGYDYAIPAIAGFTHTDLDGVGSDGGGGDLLVVPMKGAYTGSSRPALLGAPNSEGSLAFYSYAKPYSHLAETAQPGYYQVDLLDASPDTSSLTGLLPGAINAEMTAATRSGWDQYTFPATSSTATLVFDLSCNFHQRINATEQIGALADGRATISGELDSNFNGINYTLYYYAETTAPATSVRSWGNDGTLSSATSQSGTDAGAILQFDTSVSQVVGIKITLSPISAEQARIDQANELGNSTFQYVRGAAYQQWNDLLSRVAVTASSTSDPDGTLEELFYTHLYAMFGTPMNATSTTGLYRGVDGQVHQAEGYIHYDGFSTWDDFHKYGVIALVDPQRYADMTRSMVDLFADLSHTTQTTPAALTNSVPTVRFERSAVVIADALAKGVSLPRLAEAYPALKTFSNSTWTAANLKLGYFPSDEGDLLGTSYDDWALSLIASSLGNTADATALAQQATQYRSTFNNAGFTAPSGDQVGLLWPKGTNGSFDSLDPTAFGADNLYQGTMWQYNWYDAGDLGGLMQMMGGQSNFAEAAEFFMGEQSPDDCSGMLHSNANEIDLIAAYLFDFAGEPSHTQNWVRQIYGGSSCNHYISATDDYPYALAENGEYLVPSKMQVYQLQPAGFLATMDNDIGTMSSMFVAAALGLYPAITGTDTYVIGSPFFEKVTLPTVDGGTFTISANGVTPSSYYIQSAQLAPCTLNRDWIQYGDITSGGSMSFTMGSTASTWGNTSTLPPSLSDSLPVAGFNPRAGVDTSACPQARPAP